MVGLAQPSRHIRDPDLGKIAKWLTPGVRTTQRSATLDSGIGCLSFMSRAARGHPCAALRRPVKKARNRIPERALRCMSFVDLARVCV